ncbi:MAG: hypothetical protein U0V87_03330 [Acidobacteriota bacterium]
MSGRMLLALLASLLTVPVTDADNLKVAAHLYSRAADGAVRSAIELQIAEGWHLYHTELGPPDAIGKPTVITMAGNGIEWSPAVFPSPKRLEQPGLGEDGKDTWIWGHEGRVVVRIDGSLTAPATGNDVAASITGLDMQGRRHVRPVPRRAGQRRPGDDLLFCR